MTDVIDDSLNRRIYLELTAQLTGWSNTRPEPERISHDKIREVAQDGANQVCAWLDPDNPPLTAEQLARMKPREPQSTDPSEAERKARALMDADYTVFHDDVVRGLLADIDRLRELVHIWKV